MMRAVKVGTRLTLVLLLALTPVVAVYTYWSVTRSTRTYIDDLKRETRASTRALVPVMENDLRQHEWDQIHDVLRRMSRDGTWSAVFDSAGKLSAAQSSFPPELAPGNAQFAMANAHHFAEFERWVGGRRWFCRLVKVNSGGDSAGYLLVAQDWTDISEDLQARRVGSVADAIVLMALIAAIIPLAIRRYVSNPLSELSRRVTRFSDQGPADRGPAGDEVCSSAIGANSSSSAGCNTPTASPPSARWPRAWRMKSARQWVSFARAPSICCTTDRLQPSSTKALKSLSSK
jgi:hypothetical protein